MDESMDESKQIEKAKDRRIWLIKPGTHAERWEDCIDKGIICGGWKEAVDEYGERLHKFKNYDECKKKMDKLQNKIKKLGKEFGKTEELCWFLNEMSAGDIVLAVEAIIKEKVINNKLKKVIDGGAILGIGVIKSEPYIDDKPDKECPLYREVIWFKTNLNYRI